MSNLLFTKTHEWVEFLDETTAKIGLTDYAQKELGDLVFVNLPEAGDEIGAGESIGDVESVKAVSEVYSPVTGTVSKVNEELLDHPDLINSEPYESWFVIFEDITDKEELLEKAEYERFLKGEE
ncbi:glycine cleavage system protein GcvH [Anaerocolumna xylanovorans]|uniref:Glycine cleavage system H protein n=1 Tax=Anaerocolumna xylanovorans DSM 12503 TaxID=1121345 RepID=A0A1M7Y0M0_9FIRM|nr:glycine cleavage system protein GcvH [Anaerocolumna xylanovorans]SHO44911.1 glycine cleavage system H protein [Anaerocolumna xylanovorans DSM 12503]